MLAKQSNLNSNVFLFLIACSLIGILFAKALFSVAIGLMLILAIIDSAKRKTIEIPKVELAILGLIFFLYLIDLLRGGDLKIVQHKILLKSQLLILPLAMFQFKRQLRAHHKAILKYAVFLIAFVNLSSLLNYFMDKEHYDQLLLQSKHIPITGGLHHIYFGILNTLCIMALITQSKNDSNGLRWILIAILVLSMHVLSSRTGLLMLYSGFVLWLIERSIRKAKIKQLILGLLLVITMPVMSYYGSSSFRNKVHNSMEDIEHWQEGKDINYKSMAMRLEAYQVSAETYKDAPFFGHSSGHAKRAMQKKYDELKSILVPENRIGPHNQFLESSMTHGIIGLILLILWLIVMYNDSRRGFTPLFLAMFVIVFMFESALERQAGIFMVVFFTYFIRFRYAAEA